MDLVQHPISYLRMKKIVLLSIVLSIVSCSEVEKNAESSTVEIDSLNIKIEKLRNENSSLRKDLMEKTAETNYWYANDFEGRKLMDQGIINPAAYIADQLKNQPEIIPMKAVLGGKMHFLNVQILGREWIIADYEDGHVLGKAIFKYKVSKDGKVDFELISQEAQ